MLIGTAITGAATIAVLIAKGNFREARNVAKNIEFKPAKTIEEAKTFAKNKLGVQYNDIEDVDIVNYINGWLTKAHNNVKGEIDKLSYPKFITNDNSIPIDATFSMLTGTIKDKKVEGYILGINVNSFKNFDKFLEKLFKDATGKSYKDVSINELPEYYHTNFTKDLFERIRNFDNSKATFDEKIKIINDFNKIKSGVIKNNKNVPANISEYRDLWHELGHLRHQASATNYNEMQKVEEYLSQNQKVSSITNDFVKDAKKQKTAKKVSLYATESPLEFVAEVFAGRQE